MRCPLCNKERVRNTTIKRYGCCYDCYVVDGFRHPSDPGHTNIEGVGAQRHTPQCEQKLYKKRPIPKKVRGAVWRLSFGNSMDGSCYCCSTKIAYDEHHCGHILAEVRGGKTEIDNLKPICSGCNSQMGTTNMEEFKNMFRSESTGDKTTRERFVLLQRRIDEMNSCDQRIATLIESIARMTAELDSERERSRLIYSRFQKDYDVASRKDLHDVQESADVEGAAKEEIDVIHFTQRVNSPQSAPSASAPSGAGSKFCINCGDKASGNCASVTDSGSVPNSVGVQNALRSDVISITSILKNLFFTEKSDTDQIKDVTEKK